MGVINYFWILKSLRVYIVASVIIDAVFSYSHVVNFSFSFLTLKKKKKQSYFL